MDKRYKIVFFAAFIILLLDHITKFLIIRNFEYGQSIPIIENIFHLTYITNTGSAFGILKGINWFFILLSIAVIAAIVYNLKKINPKQKWILFSFGLLLGGALGNLMDRIVHGAVIDFLDFRIWPVFNIADSAITIGVVMLVFLVWKND